MKIRVRYHDNAQEVQQDLSRWFRISVTLLAMSCVALLSALISMRLAIHAGEVEVPNLQGMTLDEASQQARSSRMNLTVENRFYSLTVPAGRVLSQSPAPGATVRKGWHMRITESMGPQKVAVPDVVGESEREAAMTIRRASLDFGTPAHLPAPGTPDTVLAQTPPPNAEGVDKPEVSVLLSEPEPAGGATAYVMPSLIGLSWQGANARMKPMGMHLWAIVPQPAQPSVAPAIAGQPAPPPPPPPPVMVPAGIVLSQVPEAGARVDSGDNPHVKMSAGALAQSQAGSASAAKPATATAPKPGTAPAAKPGTPAAAPSQKASPAAPIVRRTPSGASVPNGNGTHSQAQRQAPQRARK